MFKNFLKFNMKANFLINILFLLYQLSCIFCDDIFGCGGFVKSNFTINYSRVEIKLYTKHGSLKYHTDCAPHNGYYLLPLYDKGDYILKIEPPAGWSFEPSSVSLHVDGKTDPCSLNQDINFTFKGFTISGQVLSREENTGPSGINIVLKDAESHKLNETVSGSGGQFSFSELLPGKYRIEGSHPTWLFDQSYEDIQIIDDNLRTRNKIVIAGYDVSGSVFSDGQPIQGVHFLLYSEKTLTTPPGCNSEPVKGFKHTSNMFYICHVTSSSDGKFIFPSLPPGNYNLIPFYKGEHIEFDVSPPSLSFIVNEGSYHISKSFQVEGFSVSGWIGTNSKGKSLQNVSVYINGKIHGTTDENGIYHLENMRSGMYHLDFKKESLLFESKEMKINPNTPRLPDIYVSKFTVCGQLSIEEYPVGLERSERFMVLKSLSNNNQELLVKVDVDFTFYCYAFPGKYSIEPKISEVEGSFGLKFVPEKQMIEIIDEPLSGIIFKQFRAEVKGQLKCIEKCSDIFLDLAPLSHDRPHLKATVDDSGAFEFEKCLPGNYILSLIKDEWCFQSKTLKFTIIDKDILNLELYQTGFQATIVLTHASTFKVKYPSGEFHDIELHKSKNAICLPEKGVYEFIPVGCHLYKKDSFKFDTNNPVEINLSPIKHLVTGNILTEANVTDIKVHIKKQPNSAEDLISLQEPLDKKGNYYRYTFSVFAPPNSDLELKVSSKQLLFRPSSSVVKVEEDCLENAVEIIGKRGLFLNGSITPPIEKVNIKVFKRSEDNIFAETVTDEKGMFLVGPLEDESDYIVEAETEGYVFTPLEKIGHFKAFKLAEIIADVKDEDGSPLGGVLLSLTGGSDYRKNSITQKNGKLSFTGLGPGKYFLRSMLKEFSFEPPSKMIDIKEGTQVNIEIIGKRVAYSLYGVVTSLTGEAEIGIAVEAVGVKDGNYNQYQEEAISEQGGLFRIRGLQPGCEYILHLKPGTEVNQHIERSTPKELLVKVTDGDITGIRLIVFRYYGQMDVSGNVITSQEFLNTLKVRLYREDVPDQVVHSQSLGLSSFFFLPSMPIDNKVYNLRLETSLPSNTYHFDQPSVTFNANKTFYHFTFNFNPKVKTVEQEVTQGSILALPFTLLVLILAYNYPKILPMFTNFFQTVSTLPTAGRTQSATESVLENIAARKKARPKRIQ